MEVVTRAVHIELTNENQKHIDTKCAHFCKRFANAVLMNLEIRLDRHHRKGDVITIRASLSLSSGESKLIHAQNSEETFSKALDEVLNALARQLERMKAHPRKPHEA